MAPTAVLPLLAALVLGGARQESDPPDAPAAAAAARALRAPRPPVLDGSADDEAWRRAPVRADFRQFQPRIDAEPSLRTAFQVAFDDRNLYVFVRAYDPRPDSIMRSLTRRDERGPSDQLKVMIDSYGDRRTGFEFAVNPDGVKRDFAMYGDGAEDASWNGVWDVATAVDSLGWTAEFRIPLSQLRFPGAPVHGVGFGVWRDIERYAERVSWPLYSPQRTGLVSQLGRIEGLDGLRGHRPLEVTPYVVTKNATRAAASGFERVQDLDAGADVKWGIADGVTLDATLNPDFGQVEADPAVLNLTAFETFLSERRPFFIEGTGLYQFSLNCYIVVDCSTNEGLFYSRRIGRAPVLRFAHGDAATPAATPIAGAAKLTGRSARGLSFGVLDAVTPRVAGAGGATVEPLTNFAVARVRQDLRDGDADIGLIATAVHRSLDEWSRPFLHETAWVAGASARTRMADDQYELSASLTASRVAGSADAIARTQRSAVHYYQQPGDDAVIDATRTSLSGSALHLKFGKYGGGATRFETSLIRQSPGFDPNDLGFLRRSDILDWSTWASLVFRDQTTMYRWLQLNINHWEHWNTSGVRLENALNLNGHIGLNNNWDLHAGGTLGRLGRSFCDRCTRGGPVVRRSSGLFPWFGVNGDNRMRVVPSLWVNLGYTDEGRTRTASLSPSLNLRLSTRFRVQLGANVSRVDDRSQWLGNFTDEGAGTTHYTFARLEQNTTSLNVRINYTATPDLTFEFYGQPFISSGTYSNVRELSPTPDADAYADRYVPFQPPADVPLEFTVMQLRTNAVLRWEYRPGSTLFLVWSHGRQGDWDDRLQSSWSDDYDRLFDLHPDNTFLVKVSYWLNR